jgi:hypothetical protein
MRYPSIFVSHQEAMLLKQKFEEAINESLNRIDFTTRKRIKRVFIDDILAIEENIEAFRIGGEAKEKK